MNQTPLPTHELAQAVRLLRPIVGKRIRRLPVLGCVHVKTLGSKTTLTGTDLDATIHVEIVHRLQRPANFLIAFDDLVVASKNTSPCVLLSPLADTAPMADFPPLPKPCETPSDLPSEIARQAFSVASTDEARYVLNGIFLERAFGKKLTGNIVATDGRRLQVSNSCDFSALSENVILPRHKAVLALLASADSVRLGVSKDKEFITLRSKGVSLMIRAINGDYPNWRQVVPSDYAFSASFNPNEVLQTLATLPCFEGNCRAVCLNVRDGGCEISVTHPNSNKTVSREVCCESDGRIIIYFSRDFLTDAFRMGFRRMEFNYDAPCPIQKKLVSQPAVFRDLIGHGDPISRRFHVLMPMRPM